MDELSSTDHRRIEVIRVLRAFGPKGAASIDVFAEMSRGSIPTITSDLRFFCHDEIGLARFDPNRGRYVATKGRRK